MKYNVYDCSMIELSKHHSDRKGNISVVQNGDTVPFDVKRVYYLYDVPGGESRGAHAHRELSQLIVAASGSFRVTPGIWRDLDDFSSGAVCMVLASEKYDVSDYIRDYGEFLEFRHTEITDNTESL